eukprot:8903579-Pyramimonas_sp.AAC.1
MRGLEDQGWALPPPALVLALAVEIYHIAELHARAGRRAATASTQSSTQSLAGFLLRWYFTCIGEV